MRKHLSFTIIIMIAFSILTGCLDDKDQSVTKEISRFSIEENLDTIFTVSPQCGENLTNSINIAGEHYVCIDYDAPFLLSVYNKDFNLTDTIVKRGHGHNEMLSALYFGQWSGSQENPDIIVYDMENRQIASLNISPFKGVKTVTNLSKVSDISPSKILLLQNSNLVGINLPAGEQAQLFKYDIKDKKVIFSTDVIKFNDSNAFYTSQCGLAVSDDEKQFITPYYSLPLICIYDENLNLKKKIFIGKAIDNETITINDTYLGFVDLKIIDDKLVALLMDPSGKENSKLLVFDMEGEPIASYSIGKAMGFCIDKHLDRIISLGYDDTTDMMKFFIYKLPQLIKS